MKFSFIGEQQSDIELRERGRKYYIYNIILYKIMYIRLNTPLDLLYLHTYQMRDLKKIILNVNRVFHKF